MHMSDPKKGKTKVNIAVWNNASFLAIAEWLKTFLLRIERSYSK